MTFANHLKPAEASISEAVASLTTAITHAASLNKLEIVLWQTWRELWSLVASTPHGSQQVLVDFVRAVQDAEDPRQENGELCDIWGEEFKWRDLPLFGAQTREEWDEGLFKQYNDNQIVRLRESKTVGK